MSAVLEREYVLPPMTELRLVTAAAAKAEPTTVTLHPPGEEEVEARGAAGPRADIFGSELQPGLPARLPPARSVAVYSPTGCRLTVAAPPAVLQRGYQTDVGAVWMRSAVELHSHLEAARVGARGSGGMGPRVLLVSDRPHCGVSTLCQLLAQFAVRLGYHPLLLDAATTPRFAYPGGCALYHLQHTIDVEEELLFAPALHAALGTPRETNPSLFLHVLRQLLRLAEERMARHDRCRVGGLFLDYGVVAPSAVAAAEAPPTGAEAGSRQPLENPLDVLLDAIVEADVDHVLVLQSGWLPFKLAQRAQARWSPDAPPLRRAPPRVTCGPSGQSFALLRADGVDVVPLLDPVALRRQRWMQYFFGTRTSPVRPVLLPVDLRHVRIALIGGPDHGSLTTLMPMQDDDDEEGAGGESDPASVSFLTTQDLELEGQVVAISTATEYEASPDGGLERVPFTEFERRVRQCFVKGYALVESVSADRLSLLVNGAPLRQELGVCLLVINEALRSQK